MRKRCPAMLALRLICTAGTAAPMPDGIGRSVHDRGGRRTIEVLEKAGAWDVVTDAISAGRADWIALAPMLAPASDAGSAEDLGISLAFALSRNPRAVLAALDGTNGNVIGVDRVCGRPFIEDTEPKGYVPRAIAAVSSVREPVLLGRRRAWLAALRANR